MTQCVATVFISQLRTVWRQKFPCETLRAGLQIAGSKHEEQGREQGFLSRMLSRRSFHKCDLWSSRRMGILSAVFALAFVIVAAEGEDSGGESPTVQTPQFANDPVRVCT